MQISLSFITWLYSSFLGNCKFYDIIANKSSCRPIRSGTAWSTDFVITVMITSRIGLHSVLLPLLIKLQWFGVVVISHVRAFQACKASEARSKHGSLKTRKNRKFRIRK